MIAQSVLAKQVLDATLGVTNWIREHGASIGMDTQQQQNLVSYGEKIAPYQQKLVNDLTPVVSKNSGMSMN